MDLSTELRALWRRSWARPLLPALAVVVLVLGIGSSTAVIGLAYAALLRPLPYPAADELTVVSSSFPNAGLRDMGLSGPEATELGSLTTGFAALGFGYETQVAVATGDTAIEADVAYVSFGLLRALNPHARGRLFDATDDRPGDPRRVLLGEAFWRRALGADPATVGRLLVVDGRSYEVVGVLPPRVEFVGRPVDLWIPLQYDVRAPDANRANHAFTVIGRRRAGLTPAALSADIDRAVARWADATGQFHVPDAKFHPLSITPLTERIRGPIRRAMWVLLAAVGLVLFISSANAVTLLIASADSRRTEMAVRMAIGAGPWQLFRLHLTEATVIAIVSMTGGTALTWSVGHLLDALAPPALNHLDLILSVWQTLWVAGLVTLGVAIVCTIAPFARLALAHLPTALSGENRSATAGADRQVGRRVLVSLEVALALALFSGAFAMIESFWRLAHVELGFRPEGVVHALVTLPAARYTDRDAIDAFYQQVIDNLQATPGLTAAGVLSGLPPQRRPNNSSFLVDGQPSDPHTGLPPIQFLQFASAGAFSALGIELKQGRLFTDDDRRGSQAVALINERMARTYFPGGSPLGRRLRAFGHNLPWMTVAGVIGDVRQNGLGQDVGTEVFIPVRQADNAYGAPMTRDLFLFVRVGRTDVAVGANAIRHVVRDVDPAAAVSDVASMDDVVGQSIAPTRFLTSVLGAFALVALLLSSSGVYGLVMHTVNARTREIGVRRSLGAGHGAIVRVIAGQAATLVGVGVIAGSLAALAAGRALAPFVFKVPPQSPSRVAAVAVVLTLTAAAACAVPLFRALRVDPAVALRH
jgi:putative ABC transport system permease protein